MSVASLVRAGAALPGPVRGALWMTLASGSFSVMTALIRPAAEEVHPFEIVFFRNLFGLILLSPLIFRQGLGALRTTRLRLHLLRAACFLGAMLCWFSAIPHVTLVDAISLNFTAPIFITILAALVLHEQVRARRWTAVAFGFAGAIVILRPGFQEFNFWLILVLGDATIWSIAAIVIRILTRTDSPTTIVAHMFMWVTPASFVLALFVWHTPSWHTLMVLFALSLASTIGHVAMTRAFQAAEASVLVPFDYTRLVFGGLIGFLAFGEIPDKWTLAGAAVIIGSALYIAHREGKLSRAAHKAEPAGAGDA
ncbi:MAG: DMT family transporter [Alphaproteobacteria bacterium]